MQPWLVPAAEASASSCSVFSPTAATSRGRKKGRSEVSQARPLDGQSIRRKEILTQIVVVLHPGLWGVGRAREWLQSQVWHHDSIRRRDKQKKEARHVRDQRERHAAGRERGADTFRDSHKSKKARDPKMEGRSSNLFT